MKKNATKMIAMAMAMGMLLGGATACGGDSGGGNVSGGAQTLQVYCTEAGYGVEWLHSLLDLFKEQSWVKEKYPELKIAYPTTNDVRSFPGSMLSAGAKTNNYDLLFGIDLNSYGGSDGELLNLSEGLYNATVPGEKVLYKDKLATSLVETHRYPNLSNPDSEEYYFASWIGGMSSFIYNETILQSFGIDVPKTTDELIAACATIKANEGQNNGKYNKGSSIVMSLTDADYWQYLYPNWWAQYDSIADYNNFYNGIYNGRYSVDVFKRTGRLESLKVMEELLDYDAGYFNKASFNYQFMQAQTSFLQGNDVFHFNGDWFTNEMASTYDQLKSSNQLGGNFRMMKVPVISALGDKLGITDAELSAIVDYIDGETQTAPTFTSTVSMDNNAVIERVREARSVNFSLASVHVGCIPKYADGKEIAIDFLRFMATDIANIEYTKVTQSPLYFDYNLKESAPQVYNGLNQIAKDSVDFFQNSNFKAYTLRKDTSFPLVMYGGLSSLATTHYTQILSAKDAETAETLFNNTIALWSADKFNQALARAGLV